MTPRSSFGPALGCSHRQDHGVARTFVQRELTSNTDDTDMAPMPIPIGDMGRALQDDVVSRRPARDRVRWNRWLDGGRYRETQEPSIRLRHAHFAGDRCDFHR